VQKNVGEKTHPSFRRNVPLIAFAFPSLGILGLATAQLASLKHARRR